MKKLESVEVKAGILNTIAKSIYSDIRIKTREAVSNSIDNKASHFIITVDDNSNSISFFDNGKGINQNRFQEIFKSIGYGALRENDANSYFGLGLISILQMGNTATIISNAYSEGKVIERNIYKIESGKIFNENTENKSVSEISEYIKFGSRIVNREELSIFSKDALENIIGSESPKFFTEIILEDVDMSIIEKFSSLDFVNKLRKILPLRTDYNNAFFTHFLDGNKFKDDVELEADSKLKDIKNILSDPEFCDTITVYHGNKGSEEGHVELDKYYPILKPEIVFGEDDIRIYESKDKSFKAYFLISSQDIEQHEKDSPNETGLWVRNRNILVKSADFFVKPGERKGIVDSPLKTWLFGEVFHKDMTDMLVVTRDEYLWDNSDFTSFRNEIKDALSSINKEYRDIWQRGKKVVKTVIEPFEQLKKGGMFKNFHEVLLNAKLIEDNQSIEEFRNKYISQWVNSDLEDNAYLVSEQLKESRSDLILADDLDDGMSIRVSHKPFESNSSYIKRRDPDSDRIIVLISPDIFKPFRTEFLNKFFTVNYVLNKFSKTDISINEEKEQIYINLIGDDVSKYTISFIDYILMIKIAHQLANTKDEMYRILLDLIGNRTSTQKGITNFGGKIFNTMQDIFNRR